MKKVGLYFGSFNPIHIGHLIVASQLREKAKLDEVWFVVSPQNPFKESKDLAPEDLRLNWVKQSIAGCDYLQVCDIEFGMEKPSYTFQTLKKLRDNFPHQFHLLMGSDTFESLPTWKNAADYMHNYPIHIFERGEKLNKKQLLTNAHCYDLPLLHISASLIRDLCKQNESIDFMVNNEINTEVKNYFS